MTQTVFNPIEARTAPKNTVGLVPWLKANLFSSVGNSIITLALVAIALWALANALGWGVVNAITAPDADKCQAARGIGACWGVVTEKGRLILLGRYPQAEHWRPVLATVLLFSLVIASCVKACWKPWLIGAWALGIALFFVLMLGGWFGLSKVPTDQWGGLPLTLMLTVFSMALAFPLAILVALGRRSDMPAIRSVCIVYVELIRGVPLISVLFMASFMFPLFMPVGKSPDVLIRVIVGMMLFTAAYMAEIIRGGLQALPKGQYEAAASLGMNYWQTQWKVVLPQALATVVPSMMNSFIAMFKDTSLVTIVSLYELTGALSLAVGSDPDWRPFKIEAYLFIAVIYFACCFAMSRYSLWIEKQVAVGKQR